jgi:hypothetical protein
MFNTPKMGIPWMSEFEDPFIVTDQAKAAAVDNWTQAIYENGRLAIVTEAVFDISGGNVSWDKPIVIGSAQTGRQLVVAPGSEACADGEMLYVTAPSRPFPVGPTAVSMEHGSSLGVSQTQIPIGLRVGNRLYLVDRADEANYYYHGETSFGEFLEQYPPSSDAGDFNSGAWITRALNTVQRISGDDVNESFPAISIEPGYYHVEASAPAYRVDKHQTRLRDVTGGSTLLIGSTEMCGRSTGLLIDTYVQTRSFVSGYFATSSQIDIELQHRCFSTQLADGLGLGIWGPGDDFGEDECFAKLNIRRIG